MPGSGRSFQPYCKSTAPGSSATIFAPKPSPECSPQGGEEKTNGMLKMPPGPIDALIRNAAAANLQIKLNQNDEIVIVKPNGTHIPLLAWGKSAWQEEVKEAIGDSFLQLLSIQ